MGKNNQKEKQLALKLLEYCETLPNSNKSLSTSFILVILVKIIFILSTFENRFLGNIYLLCTERLFPKPKNIKFIDSFYNK